MLAIVIVVVAVLAVVLSVLAVVQPFRVKFTLNKTGVTLEAEGTRRPRQVAPPRKRPGHIKPTSTDDAAS